MGVFKRVKEIAAADMHALLDKCEDPVTMAKHGLRQLEEQIEKTTEALAAQLAAEQEFLLLIEHTTQIALKRMRQAELAVDREEERIAELALADKLQQDKLLHGYEQTLAVIRGQISALKQELVRLKELYRDWNNRLHFLALRAKAARAIESASAYTSYRADQAVRGFDRLEEKVRMLEAGASARQFSTVPQQPTLEQLERREAVQAELERLKAARGERQTG
ncbi:PspA/IM30 family protein [Paenibacillus soyae]|uniref:PspA/IM30 family protein n=1 Tax=Paenibacillus soyae TaxID=2969249 RepID=A0A9X2MVT1_9BACL|nr:PspA/IM30 family protein [Paenibacillus soyae]MCR2807986.1 PspA/IM30 family protein [Paenibacillus soyae]